MQDSVVAKFATTATDGKTYQVEYFNLDAIISVGYRVNSIRGMQFRIWATERIKEYIVTAYLEMAEIQALNRQPMTMEDWVERLNVFLTMTGRELLNHAGKVSHDVAISKAHAEYEKFKQKQLETD